MASTLKQKIQNLFNHKGLRNLYNNVLTRRKRLLLLGVGILFLFFLCNLLYHAGSDKRIVSFVVKDEVADQDSQVVAIASPLQTYVEGESSQEASDKKVSGYRKSSDFFRSIVRGNAHAVCVGSDETRGEVDDLFCMPKPAYDPNMKNPCWWENITQTPAPGMLQASSKTVSSLSCLPYFHILCCSKSGTTDLFRRISLHADIVPNFGQFGKERLWWCWNKYGYRTRHDKADPIPMYKYVKGFGILARYLEKASATGSRDLKRLITVDGSPADMWDLRGWTQLPQNRGLRQPAVITPHLMRYLYRNPKFIVLARDPVERLYTAYLFHGLGRTSEEFHRDVLKGIAFFNHCLDIAQDRIECFVNNTVFEQLTVDIHFSCYTVYFEEWLKVFPKKHFLFLRTEDYSADMKGSLLKVFKFLDLPKPSANDLQKMVTIPQSYHTKQRDLAGPMLPETRAILRDWFRPWNQELARLLKDKGYLWEDKSAES